MYPKVTVQEPSATLVSRWGQDEFSLGSYSFIAAGGRDLPALATPLSGEDDDLPETTIAANGQGRLLFAGEATSETRYGYMDGALETGKREAQRLIRMYYGEGE